MALQGPLEELLEALRCPFCLGPFTDPMTLECGHNFCRACLLQHWVGLGQASRCCPECQKQLLQREGGPNWQLGKVAQLVKKLWQQRRARRQGEVCGRHRRPLKHFCRDDQALLCVICKRRKAHKGHVVELLEEAAHLLKEKTKAELRAMEREVQRGIPKDLEETILHLDTEQEPRACPVVSEQGEQAGEGKRE